MSSRSGLNHIDLNVSNLPRSAAFYDRVLGYLGYRRAEQRGTGDADGYDWYPAADPGEAASIGMYLARSTAMTHDRHAPGLHHLALNAGSREAVDRLHRLLLEMGATILDAPREYPQYEPGYYAVFFLDPDGIKLECVWPGLDES